MRPHLLPAVAAALAASILAHAATAQGRNLYLEEGKRRYAQGRFEQAIEELEQALRLPGLPPEQRVEILAWLGAAHHALGHEEEAREVWEQRVRLAPDLPLPGGISEAAVAAYKEVEASTVVLEHLTPPAAFAGRPLQLFASLQDPKGRVAEVLVYWRRAGAPTYAVVPGRREGDTWVAEIPLPPLAGRVDHYEVEYYLEAVSKDGEILDAAGSAERPIRITAVAPAGPPVTASEESGVEALGAAVAVDAGEREAVRTRGRRSPEPRAGLPPWVWVVGGVLVVGATAGILYASGRPSVPSTSLGVVTYP